jgi:CspA family cold shock protein
MLAGKISSISAEKGFGFITPAEGGPDLFFHCSAVDAEFKSLQVEQPVQYEMDEAAAKPRAQRVLTGASSPRAGFIKSSQPAPRRQGPVVSRPRPPVPVEPKIYGFVTKLPRKKPIGFISSEQGGAEYFFEPADMQGRIRFAELAVGDYVCFIARDNPEDPKQPFAKSVMAIPKPLPKQENSLPKHPRARRKKPTWRSQE